MARSPAGDIAVAPMRWWDIEQLVALEQVLFPTDSPWSAAMFWSELAAGHHYVVHRGPDGDPLGYAGLAIGPDAADVQTIGVAPRARRRGIGRALLADLLAAAGAVPVLLDVRTDNDPAMALYESEGFQRIGLRRHYYQPSGADAYTMLRPATRMITGVVESPLPGEADSTQQMINRGTR